MVLPLNVTAGQTTGHLLHHGELHEAAGVFGLVVQVNAGGHLDSHRRLKQWYDTVTPANPLPDVVDPASHELVHELLHARAEQSFILGQTLPDEFNTGSRIASVNLQTHSGDLTINNDDVVVTGMYVTGRIIVNGKRVVVRDCEAVGVTTLGRTQEQFLIDINASGTDALVEFVTMHRVGNPGESIEGARINGARAKIRRCKVYDVVDHFGLVAADISLEGNYAFDQLYYAPALTQPGDNQTHNDIIQYHPGVIRPIIIGNVLESKYGNAGTHQPDHRSHFDQTGVYSPSGHETTSSAVMMFGGNMGSDYVLNAVVEDNWMNGGFIPINHGSTVRCQYGRMWRNTFDGDSYRLGSYVPGPSFDNSTYTLSFDSTCIVDTGQGTANRNTYSNGGAVNDRRNG